MILLGIAAAPAHAAGDGSANDNPDLGRMSCDCVLAAAPREPSGAALDFDWSVGLRGAYVIDNGDVGYEAQILPQFALLHKGAREDATLTGSGQLSVTAGGATRIDALELGFAGQYRFDALTSIAANATFLLTEAKPDDPNLPANTAIAPLVFEGTGEVSIARLLGQFELTPRLTLGRTIKGPTTLVDLSQIDNTAENNWRAGAGLRLGYRLTPSLTVFVDGAATYSLYDAPDPVLTVPLDNVRYDAKLGASYKWNNALSAESTVGLGYLDYVDPGITDTIGALYQASLTIKPAEALSLTAALATDLRPSSGTPGDTTLATALTGSAALAVSPWLGLRGSAAWHYDRVLGTGATDTGYSLGAGADIATSPHVAVTADYLFERGAVSPDPATDTHSIMLGVKYSR